MCEDAEAGTAVGTVLIDNDKVRVSRWEFANRGDNTGWHRHEFDYVVIPLLDGVLDIEVAPGEIQKAELKKGEPYFRNEGVEHDVLNGNDFRFAFIEVEIR